MTEFLCSDLWPRIKELSQKSKRRDAAIAYLTLDTHLCLRRGDRLIVDASENAIKTGQTSANPRLHAKVLILDSSAFVSSGNASAASTQGNLTEAGLHTNHPQALSQIRAFFEALRDQSELLTNADIRKLESLPVRQPRFHGSLGPKFNLKLGTATWLANLYDYCEELSGEEAQLEHDATAAAEPLRSTPRGEIYAIWMRSGAKIAKHCIPGDSIIGIRRRHWQRQIPDLVDYPATLLSKTAGGGWTLLALEYPRNWAKLALPWQRFRSEFPWEKLRLNPSVKTDRRLTNSQRDQIEALWKLPIKKKNPPRKRSRNRRVTAMRLV
jgi:hypothetical protein